ncbi:SA1362 family protein [Staphylococcus chromogenes]|uniref:SA1362 family protein n=1 Tax=Staphylococcus chromogenes TaxID=46126 RepID=UPI0028FF82EC|nr:SA1362 family protein [Staphylococcus chromogenes]MDU0450570.1 SA1362 family protein [Staphylococcus chromogenes]
MKALQNIFFWIIIAVAIIGLLFNLDAVLFSLVNTLIVVIIFLGIIFLIYFFFFLTPDQRKYKKAVWKNKMRRRR